MLGLFNSINNVFLTVDIYDEAANQGDSIWPFVSFMLFAAGILIVFIGIIKLSTAKREWSIFFDRRDNSSQPDKASKKRAVNVAWITIAVGVVLFAVSFFVK